MLLEEKKVKLSKIDLYPVITPERSYYNNPIEILDMLLNTQIKIVQLRLKNCSQTQILEIGRVFRKKTLEKGILFILNDSPQLASILNADGVHLGNDDISISKARKINPNLIIGKSTHNLYEIHDAVEKGADYINLGPIFKTKTKPDVNPIGLDLIKYCKKNLNIPFSVMGNINQDNIHKVINAGCTKIGMIGGIIGYKDIKKQVNNLYKILNNEYY